MMRAPLSVRCAQRPIPAHAGIGLRAAHHETLLRELPRIGWLEAHSENYFAASGRHIDTLQQLREHYPLSLHGVGLSLGSIDPLSERHIADLRRLIDRTDPALVSEHLSWGSVDGRFVNDLLPLPYTPESLAHMIERVERVQAGLGRQILIENVSSYLQFSHSSIPENDFLIELARTCGCGILLDINNVYVNARNHGLDAQRFIASIPRALVQEIHLAGHTVIRESDFEILIDTHAAPVCAEVWDLYEFAMQRFGAVATLIEWDSELPALEVLVAEACKAELVLERCRDLAA